MRLKAIYRTIDLTVETLLFPPLDDTSAAFMRHVKLITAIFLIALIMMFAVQNYEVVQLRLFFWTVEMSRALLLFLVFVTGIGLGWIMRSLK